MGVLNDGAQLLRNKGLYWFLITYAVFLVTGLIVLMMTDHGDVVLFINRFSRIEWDQPVDWITRMGLGTTSVVVALAFALYRLRYTLMLLINLALVGLVTGIFKNWLFPEVVRPLKYFEPESFHRMVHLFDVNLLHSFPSGHSMTIFATMSLLAYFAGKKYAGLLFVFVAAIVGLSRVYLLQHFFVDVVAGSVLGLLCTFTTIWLGDHVAKLESRQIFQEQFLIYQRLHRLFTNFFR